MRNLLSTVKPLSSALWNSKPRAFDLLVMPSTRLLVVTARVDGFRLVIELL